MTTAPVRFDPGRVAAFAGGDAVFAAELTELFLQHAEDYVQEYVAAVDDKGRRQVLHKLKGAALTIGADRLAALCAIGEDDPAAALRAELRALRAELCLF